MSSNTYFTGIWGSRGPACSTVSGRRWHWWPGESQTICYHPVAKPGRKGVKFHPPTSTSGYGGPFLIQSINDCNLLPSKFNENKQFTYLGMSIVHVVSTKVIKPQRRILSSRRPNLGQRRTLESKVGEKRIDSISLKGGPSDQGGPSMAKFTPVTRALAAPLLPPCQNLR